MEVIVHTATVYRNRVLYVLYTAALRCAFVLCEPGDSNGCQLQVATHSAMRNAQQLLMHTDQSLPDLKSHITTDSTDHPSARSLARKNMFKS